MTKLVNRAKMTTASTGTGSPITLGSAVDGYQTFADAGVANGDVVRYVIEDGDAWEIGTGTYTASGTTLSRTVVESSNADAALNLTGNATVFVTAAAADILQPGDNISSLTNDAGYTTIAGVTYSRKTANYTASAREAIIADTSGGAWTLTLPASPSAGDFVIVSDGADWSATNLIVGRNGSTIEGDAEDMTMNIGNVSVTFVYDGTTWQVYAQVGAAGDAVTSLADLGITATATELNYTDGVTGNIQTQLDAKAPALSAQSLSGGSQALDFDAANAFESTASQEVTTYTFSATGQKQALLIVENSAQIPWGIGAMFYDGNEFYVSNQVYSTDGIAFSQDGTRLYTGGGSRVYQYNLNTAWDLSTASYSGTSFIAQGDVGGGLFFRPDGTKFYTVDFFTDSIHQYSLGTAWDLSTASYDSVTFGTAPPENTPRSVFFSPDGLNMYINSTSAIHWYTLSTAWLMSSATLQTTFTIPSSQRNAYNVVFKTDGSQLYFVGTSTSKLYSYTLSTAWDLTTAVDTGETFTFGEEFSSWSTGGFCYIKPDGTKFFVSAGANDPAGGVSVFQYTLNGAISLVLPSECEVPEDILLPLLGQKSAYSFVTLDGGTSYKMVSALGGLS